MSIVYKNSYVKDLKKVQKYPRYDEKQVNILLNALAKGERLDPKYKDHKLAPSSPAAYQGCRCFHASPDIAIVYRVIPNGIEVIRIGKHNTLGLTEDL